MLSLVVRSFGGIVTKGGTLRSQVFFRLRRERVRIANQVGEGGEAERMLAQRMGVSQDRLEQMLRRLDERDVPLDHRVGASMCPADYLPAPDDQEHLLAREQIDIRMKEVLDAAIATLDERERFITQHRLMAPSSEELSLAEIGRRLEVSRERARQLEERAKRKLRRAVAASQEGVIQDWLATG
jgi:RNA polymerase sigma-32 factor